VTKGVVLLQTVVLLSLSNVFMTYAGIAFFEYMLQVPANRIGYTQFSVGQLKILQEVITLSVFLPFSVFFLRQPLRLDYLWAALCVLGAVYFVFRGSSFGH
jgi:uncharacterized protein